MSNYMSNYMVIICFLLFLLYTSPPLEGLGEVCMVFYMVINGEP